ncbi:MAG: AI-2E family transporter, partial [Pirellulaceae bacterium]|nr:AI-2E family transporter [Pirellulaceae bacterium]
MGQSKVSPLQVVSYAANVFVFVTVVAALYLAQDVFIPLTLSMMLAFLLAPIADRLEDWGLRRVPAVLVLGVLAFSIIGGFLWVVGREATKLASNIPQYQAEIVHKVEGFSTFGSGTSQRLTKFVTAVSDALRGNKRPVRPAGPAVTGPIDDLDAKSSQVVTDQAYEPTGSADAQPDEPGNSDELGSPGNPIHTVQASNSNSPMGTALETATVVLNPLTNVGLVIVFTIFMLLSRDDLRDRLIRVLSGGRYIVTTKAIDEASRRISSYILAQTIVNSLYGLCIGFGLWLIGVTLGGEQGFPNFALWGLLCTVMRFVPYVGPILAGAFPVALSLIVFPGFSVFLATASLFTAIELLSNNVLEPWLYGSRTGMSPMAVIVAAVFWTWMWGPVGLLLAVPLTASLIVMGKYVPQLAPLTVLLGDKSPLPPHVSFYQRILAEDMSRGEKIVQAGIAESDLETWSDEVLLPTIRRIRRDRANEELSAPREHHLMQLITGMIDDQMVKSTEQANDSAKAQAKSASKNQSAVETSERIDEVASPALASHRTVARANSDVVAVVDEVVASTVTATRHHKPVDLGLEMGLE